MSYPKISTSKPLPQLHPAALYVIDCSSVSANSPAGTLPRSAKENLLQPVINQPVGDIGYPPPGATQPGVEGNLMSYSTDFSACPRILEYLVMIDQFFVQQKVEYRDECFTCEAKNKYTIKNSLGQIVYSAQEDTDCCTRNCCGNIRPFDLKIKNVTGSEVIHLRREFRCDCCCCPCYLQKVKVYSPPGTLIGTVAQEWSILTNQFRVENESGETVIRIKGPSCTYCTCGNVEFEVLSNSGEKLGKITRKWDGLLSEALADDDHFRITFPQYLDVKVKATLLGASFLIDYMFFEKKWFNRLDRPEMDILCCCACED